MGRKRWEWRTSKNPALSGSRAPSSVDPVAAYPLSDPAAHPLNSQDAEPRPVIAELSEQKTEAQLKSKPLCSFDVAEKGPKICQKSQSIWFINKIV